LNILICDDIKSETAKLERLLNESGFDVKIVSFLCGHEALEYVRTGIVIDVCFLDIVMPEMNGIILAEQLRGQGFRGQIVFLSTSRDYGPEAFSVKAFDYLLKPPRPANVRNVLKRLADEKLRSDTEGILVRISKVARHILFRDISHVEVIKHYVYFRLNDGEEIEIYATLGEFAVPLLNDHRFAQCHRSYIINMSEIASIDDREVTMRCGKNIPVSKSYMELKKKFIKWMMENKN
jgi:DNA-binding LytR/AlgR family response regulator